MKKYVKPDLVYENFELTNSIASGCNDSLNHYQDGCKLDLEKIGMGGQTLFNSGICDIDNKVFEQYCEYTSTDNLIQVFTS